MSAELYILMIGAWRAGLAVMFIDPGQPLAMREACARIIQPRALAGSWTAHAWSMTTPTLRRLSNRITTSGWWPMAKRWTNCGHNADDSAIAVCSDDDPALITFTSGSTGKPKTIVRSHGFLARQHQAIHHELNLHEGQVDLTTMPIFLLANLGSGVTSVIPRGNISRPGSINAQYVLEQIKQCGITRGGGSPAFWERLIHAPQYERHVLSTMREMYTGGGPVYIDLLQRLQKAAPLAKVIAIYGSTEAEPIASAPLSELLQHQDYADRMLPLGKPVADIRVMVISDSWGTPLRFHDESELETKVLPPGCVGEILVSGPLVISGYWLGHGDEETKVKVGNTIWHRTGDAGCFDPHGALWLAGRCSAKVNHGTQMIYPFNIELSVRNVPGIRRIALTTFQREACLAVEAEDSKAIETLKHGLARHHYTALPVIRVARIPVDRRHNSKIDYHRLETLLSQTKHRK